MGQHVDRRSILGAVGFAGGSLLSGCLYLGDSPEMQGLRVSVFNNTDDPHAFRVRLIDEAESTVFEGVFDLESGERETRETDLTETEYQVLVDVDGTQELEDTWSWRGCRTGFLDVTFWSATEGNAQSDCINE